MLNRNQRKFRKEMEKIHRDQQINSDDPVYSYVHDTFKDDHESRPVFQSKKRGKGKLGVYILLILIGIGAYQSFKHSVKSDPVATSIGEPIEANKTSPVPAINLNGTSNHQEIIDYLDWIKSEDTRLQEIFKSISFNPSENRNVYIGRIKKSQETVNQMLSDIMEKQPPKSLDTYRNVVVEKYKIASKYMATDYSAAQINDQKSASQLPVLLNDLNIQDKQKIAEMLKVFDEVGIKWEKGQDGLIHISYFK